MRRFPPPPDFRLYCIYFYPLIRPAAYPEGIPGGVMVSGEQRADFSDSEPKVLPAKHLPISELLKLRASISA